MHGILEFNNKTCTWIRNVKPYSLYYNHLKMLATDPVIWHGNGVGRKLFKINADYTMNCLLNQKNMTLAAYKSTFI